MKNTASDLTRISKYISLILRHKPETIGIELDAHGWAVDYILTHCAPTSIALQFSRHNVADHLTDFLQEVKDRAQYYYWLFGHYHDNKAIDTKHILLWEQIVQIL